MESNHCFYCLSPPHPPLQPCCKYPGATHAHHGVICCTQWSQKTLEKPSLLTLGFIHAAGPASITLALIPENSNQKNTTTTTSSSSVTHSLSAPVRCHAKHSVLKAPLTLDTTGLAHQTPDTHDAQRGKKLVESERESEGARAVCVCDKRR